MNRFLFTLSVGLIGSCLVCTGYTEEANVVQKPKTLCDMKFQIMSRDGEKELGTYSIRALEKTAKNEIEITESMSLIYRKKKVDLVSTVIYESTTPLVPKKGMAEIKIEEKSCMKGTVTFAEKTFDLESVGFLDERTGEKIEPPIKFTKKGQLLPEGILVFQSALSAIGPRLLPKEGEIEKIVFVEFPDDLGADELINFKEKHRLVREQPNEKGEYAMKIGRMGSEEFFYQIRFNKDDQIISMDISRKMKFVRIEE